MRKKNSGLTLNGLYVPITHKLLFEYTKATLILQDVVSPLGGFSKGRASCYPAVSIQFNFFHKFS